jgi:hypothetical protein
MSMMMMMMMMMMRFALNAKTLSSPVLDACLYLRFLTKNRGWNFRRQCLEAKQKTALSLVITQPVMVNS